MAELAVVTVLAASVGVEPEALHNVPGGPGGVLPKTGLLGIGHPAALVGIHGLRTPGVLRGLPGSFSSSASFAPAGISDPLAGLLHRLLVVGPAPAAAGRREGSRAAGP